MKVQPTDIVVALTMLAGEVFFLLYARYGTGRAAKVVAFVLGALTAGVWSVIVAALLMHGLA